MRRDKRCRRAIISQEAYMRAVHLLNNHAMHLCREKGYESFVSRHEILGIVGEEHHELLDVIHGKGHNEEVIHELLDTAFACLWGIASIQEGCTDHAYTDPRIQSKAS